MKNGRILAPISRNSVLTAGGSLLRSRDAAARGLSGPHRSTPRTRAPDGRPEPACGASYGIRDRAGRTPGTPGTPGPGSLTDPWIATIVTLAWRRGPNALSFMGERMG